MLELHFCVLKYVGVWCPTVISKGWKFFYKFYTVIVMTSIYALDFSQVVRLLSVRNFADFNDTFYIALANTSACFKAACYMICRKDIINLMKMFEKEFCIAQDDKERDILKRNSVRCRKIAMILLSGVYITVIVFIAVPLYKNDDQNCELPYKVSLPFDLKSPLRYWLTFSFQVFTALILISVTMTTDALIASFMVQICAQLELLQYRLNELPKRVMEEERNESQSTLETIERDSLRRLVDHHVHIFRIADAVTSTFKWVIIWQNYVIAIQICVSVYQLTFRSSNFVEIMMLLQFTSCILGEFFVYCYFGNELSIKSENVMNAISDSDWTSLPLGLKKGLVLVLHRSLKPIRISCGNFMKLNLKSFVRITKLSYSAYNVLKASPTS